VCSSDLGNPVDEQAAVHLKYEWSNVRIIVNPDSIGTQTFADLNYTNNDCQAQFRVSILTPVVDCFTAEDDPTPVQSKCDEPNDPSIGSVPPGTTTCEKQGDRTLCLPNRTEL